MKPEKINMSTSIEYNRVAQLHHLVDEKAHFGFGGVFSSSHAWKQYRVSQEVYKLLLNGMTAYGESMSQDVIRFVKETADSDLIRKTDEFKDENQDSLYKYACAATVKERREHGLKLLLQFFTENAPFCYEI